MDVRFCYTLRSICISAVIARWGGVSLIVTVKVETDFRVNHKKYIDNLMYLMYN